MMGSVTCYKYIHFLEELYLFFLLKKKSSSLNGVFIIGLFYSWTYTEMGQTLKIIAELMFYLMVLGYPEKKVHFQQLHSG